MFKILIIALLGGISGCSSNSWKAFSEINSCVYTGQVSQDRIFITQTLPTSNGYSSGFPVPLERSLYLYACNGFSTWSFNAPEVPNGQASN